MALFFVHSTIQFDFKMDNLNHLYRLKKELNYIIHLLLLGCILSSCTMEKRLYTKGYNTQWNMGSYKQPNPKKDKVQESFDYPTKHQPNREPEINKGIASNNDLVNSQETYAAIAETEGSISKTNLSHSVKVEPLHSPKVEDAELIQQREKTAQLKGKTIKSKKNSSGIGEGFMMIGNTLLMVLLIIVILAVVVTIILLVAIPSDDGG